MKNYAFVFYIILLGLLSGAIFASGVYVAPVIFHANDYLPSPLLDRLTSGMLMTQIFNKLNALMVIVATFSILYEAYSFFSTKRGVVSLFLSAMMLVSVLVFVFYCTPFIVDAQKAGMAAVESAEFGSVHKLSEALFKIILVDALVLQVIRIFFQTNSCSIKR